MLPPGSESIPEARIVLGGIDHGLFQSEHCQDETGYPRRSVFRLKLGIQFCQKIGSWNVGGINENCVRACSKADPVGLERATQRPAYSLAV